MKKTLKLFILFTVIFIIVWGIGFLGELSKTAYRDAFLNWSFIFLSVVVLKIIIKKIQSKK